MNKNNKSLFVFGFLFYFIGDLATTYIALSNGLPESGPIRIVTRYDFSIIVIMKVIFYTNTFATVIKDGYYCPICNRSFPLGIWAKAEDNKMLTLLELTAKVSCPRGSCEI